MEDGGTLSQFHTLLRSKKKLIAGKNLANKWRQLPRLMSTLAKDKPFYKNGIAKLEGCAHRFIASITHM